MNYIEMLNNSKALINKDKIKDLLEDLYSINTKLVPNSVRELISIDPSAIVYPVEQYDKDFKYTTVPTTLLRKDVEYVKKLIGAESVQEINQKISDKDLDYIENIKNTILNLITLEEDGREYYNLDSAVLFPDVEELSDNVAKYRITINSQGTSHLYLLSIIFKKLVEEKIPFNIRARVIDEDNNYGYTDSLEICINEKEFNRTCDIVKEILEENRDMVSKPNKYLGLNIDDLFSITAVERGATSYYSPMEAVFVAVEMGMDYCYNKFYNEKGYEYEFTKPSEEMLDRIYYLELFRDLGDEVDKTTGKTINNYDELAEIIMKRVEELNYNLDNVYSLNKPVKEDGFPVIEEVNEKYNSTPNVKTYDDVIAEKAMKPINSTPIPLGVSENSEAMANLSEAIEKYKAEQIIDSNEFKHNMNTSPLFNTVEENKEEPKQQMTEDLFFDLLNGREEHNEISFDRNSNDNNESTVIEEQPVIDDLNAYSVIEEVNNELRSLVASAQETTTNETSDLSTSSELPDEIDIKSEPVVEEKVDNSQEDLSPTMLIDGLVSKINESISALGEDENTEVNSVEEIPVVDEHKSKQPIMPGEDIDPKSLLMDDEEKAFNGGSNYGINNGNTGEIKIDSLNLSKDESQSLADSLNKNESEILGSYAAILPYEEAIKPICISQSGTTATLIDYLNQQDVLNKVKLDSTITDTEGNQQSGAEFVKNVVIPLFVQNTPEHIFTIDDIINERTIPTEEQPEKKKGFFSRLFKK